MSIQGIALSFACTALLFAGCEDAPSQLALTPLSQLPWPDARPVPECVPWSDAFELPATQGSLGSIQMFPSTSMVPLGVRETIHFAVLNSEGGSVDTTQFGAMDFRITKDGAEVASGVASVENGQGKFDVILSGEGRTMIQSSLQGQDRDGSLEIYGYVPQIPIWELEVDPDEFARVQATPEERIRIDALLTRDGLNYPSTLRLHGGSSRFFEKKSLRIDLDDSSLADPNLILRAEFNDKTMLRTTLGYSMFRDGTWLPVPATEFVHLRVNNAYYGLMNHVQRIGRPFLEDWGLDTNGNLYEADPPFEYAVPGGNLQPAESPEIFRQVYQFHNGEGFWDDLSELVYIVLQLPNDVFRDLASEIIDIDSYLAYLAMMAVLQNHEHIRKNFYLYHDSDGPDSRWNIFPWDLDLAMGHLWSEVDELLSEDIITDADLFTGEQASQRFGFYNQMIDRVLKIPEYRGRFLELTKRYTEGVFSIDYINPRLDYLLCQVQADMLADPKKRGTNSEIMERVDELRDFVRERSSYVDTVLNSNSSLLSP